MVEKRNIWIKDDYVYLSGVAQVILCLRQFRRTPLDRQKKKSDDYLIEKEITDFEKENKFRLFVDEDLEVYVLDDAVRKIYLGRKRGFTE